MVDIYIYIYQFQNAALLSIFLRIEIKLYGFKESLRIHFDLKVDLNLNWMAKFALSVDHGDLSIVKFITIAIYVRIEFTEWEQSKN